MQQPRIRSFIHRRSHITRGQQEALDTLSAQWVIPFESNTLNLDEVFNRQAPTVLEIGFGMGETTATIAQSNPQTNYLCIEVFNAGVGALLNRIDQMDLKNIRIIQHDAVEVLEHMIAPQTFSGVHLFFPDPWPKKRHHKRRLIQPPLVQLLASRLMSGGYLHCATDWAHYAEQMLDVLSGEPSLQNTCQGFCPRPETRPLTKFEARGLRLGHEVFDLIFKKRAVNPV